ncbi:centrosomal protein of 290 kDa-like [Ptychodera flava]|uniref:centrosomal protein of 290 kDa-like n=1 Tax=Ptychodera flava TaxID=63121 RepID=UPI00396A431E
MAPLDWNKIMEVDPDEVSDEAADDWFNTISKANVDDETDGDRLGQLFELTRAVMKIKGTQADFAEEELEKLIRNDQKQKDRIDELEEEVARARVMSGQPKDVRFLQEQVRDTERQLDLLQREMTEREKELADEKRESERYATRAEDAEREKRDLRKENDILQGENRELRAQMAAWQEREMQMKGSGYEFQATMRKKNQELAGYLDEIQNLQEANEQLQKQVSELTDNLGKAARDMDNMSEEFMKLKLVVQQSDSMTESLQKENDILKEQIRDLNVQIGSRTDADDEIMGALNEKVDEWKEALAEKDEEIAELNKILSQQRDQLTQAQVDTDKTSVVALSQALQEKNQLIEQLQKQLEDYADKMEEESALLDEFRTQAASGGAPSIQQQNTIRRLRSTMKQLEVEVKSADDRTIQADADAREKDKQLNDAIARMREYEAGEYGLADAVQEIKDGKKQIGVRDKDIEKLTQNVNKLELQMNDLMEENEDLRERLGLDPKEPIDLTDFRMNRAIQSQQDRAMNQVLTKEIERLEEERIDLKKEIRRLAGTRATRAVAEGLTTDQLDQIDDYIGDLKTGKGKSPRLADTVKRAMTMEKDKALETIRIKATQMEKELDMQDKIADKLRTQVKEYEAKNKDLNDENKQLEKGMREILDAIKDNQGQPGGADGYIQIPTLERLLAMMESRAMDGKYDMGIFMKAQIDQLTGRNDELRRELRDARTEYEKTRLLLEKERTKVEKLDKDLKALKEVGKGAVAIQQMPLPEGMAVSSSEVISSLNEHLVQVIQELTLKEEMLKKLENALDVYKRKFAVMRHQQGLVYSDFMNEKKAWEGEVEKLKEENKKLDGQRAEDAVRIQEYNRLLETLQMEGDEMQKRVANSSRKMTVLRVNEKALTRRFTMGTEVETTLRKENNRLRNEIVQMEAAVTERLGYLQRHKEMSQFKIAALQRALDDTVSASDLEAANKKYNELATKYRDLLETDNKLVTRNAHIDALENENKRLESEVDMLKSELSTGKEKLHTLEQAMEEITRISGRSPRGVTDGDFISISKKITTLEMKELNERQRADHAVRMHETQRKTITELEERNLELEQKFAELTRMNLASQKVERELRDELASCVTKAVHDAALKKSEELQKVEINLKIENSKLKEMSEVAAAQTEALEARQVSREKELTSLRKQLMDIQTQSDEKAIIGKLHHHIVALQVSEGTAVRKYEQARQKVKKLQAQVLRLEQKCDEREQALYHNKVDARNKSKHLKRTIQDLRMQFCGAVPLSQQEKFSRAMIKLKQDKEKTEKELKVAKHEREKVEDELAAIDLQHKGLQELIETIKDGRGANKVAEWHSKLQEMRLQELKQSRQIDKLKGQARFLESVNQSYERTISSLEEENVKIAKECEDKQLLWEQREVELERQLDALERQHAAMASAAQRFEEATGSLPDPSLPVANQLEHAVRMIKEHIKTILDAQAENRELKKNVSTLEKQLKTTEENLLARDKVINELRLRLPATQDRDEYFKDKTSQGIRYREVEESYDHKKAMRIAQSQLSGLQERLQSKEEAIQKYIRLLEQARQELSDERKNHNDEMRLMQRKLDEQSNRAFMDFKQKAMELVNKPSPNVISNKQLAELNELKDMVAEQDNALSAMTLKLKAANTQIAKWKEVVERRTRDHEKEKVKLAEERNAIIKKMNGEIENQKQNVRDKEEEVRQINNELETQKEANARAPTTTMKNLVERLRNQLALKEKQHKALSQALMQLRADMMTTAQENVKAHAEDAAMQNNIQKIVDKETRQLQDEVEELKSKLEKSKKDFRKFRVKEESQSSEVSELREELEKKETDIERLKLAKKKLEKENDDLQKTTDRLSAKNKRAMDADAKQMEIEELTSKVKKLENKLKEEQQKKPGAGTLSQSMRKEEQSAVEVAKWEEGKKWEKRVETLRTKLKEKDKELEHLQKQNQMMKDALSRADRDKISLQNKLKKTSGEPVLMKSTEMTTTSARPSSSTDSTVQTLRRQIYEREEEITSLRRQLTLSKDAAYEEVLQRNKFLTEKIETLEREFARRAAIAGQESGSASYEEFKEREQDLQKQILELSEENIELKFDTEQMKRDVPRLRERVEDLQRYVEVLKSDLEKEKDKNRTLSSGNLRKSLGSSGKTIPELERTIGLMKKVVERVQSENEELKKAPGVVNHTKVKDLQDDNRLLKEQLDKIRLQYGGQLSMRYESKELGTAKIISENERLRKEQRRDSDMIEKLKVEKSQVEVERNKLLKDLDEVREKLEIEEARGPRLEKADSKSWKSIVVTRMYEEKMRNMEQDLDKKSAMVQDMKILLKESAEREQTLMHECELLKEKVNVLERYPSNLKTDSDVVREFQQTRLRVDRLENEKAELLNELKSLRRHSNPLAGTPADVGQDEIVEKVRSYDKMLAENVEVRTDMKSLQLERDQLRQENEKFRKELEQFGPEFFEEIEDLKYNYREAVQRNVQYEDQLTQLSKQFGVQVNIPP